jgi:hypothetical protein
LMPKKLLVEVLFEKDFCKEKISLISFILITIFFSCELTHIDACFTLRYFYFTFFS